VPGGYYVNVWSGIGTALENNQAVVNLAGKIAQQVNINARNLSAAVSKANQANTDSGQLKTQFVGMYQIQ
jgi:hypothetical protein